MKRLGAFSEFVVKGSLPSIVTAIGDPLESRLRRLIVQYLLLAGTLLSTMERLPDVLDGEETPLTAGLRTDGVWYWRTDLAHYVAKYDVELESEFLDHAQSNAWTPPSLSEAERGLLARDLLAAWGVTSE